MDERQVQDTSVPLTCGALVILADDLVGVQAPDGTLIVAARLGPGLVQAHAADGTLSIHWLDADFTTPMVVADVHSLAADQRLVSVWRCGPQGRRKLLGRRLAALQHHWAVELRPHGLLRVLQAEGSCWTFRINSVTHEVDPPWIEAPTDDSAEALVAADVACAAADRLTEVGGCITMVLRHFAVLVGGQKWAFSIR